jgi:2-phosphosulfolactate phosphatase
MPDAQSRKPKAVSAFDQQHWTCRSEWGTGALEALAPADVVIVVDVLSFTTCVDVAVSRGGAILPYAWADPSAEDFARSHGAELAGRRRVARYSLSASSFLDVQPGFRCVLPSPNGARVAIAAAGSGSVVFTACLRNARAAAEAAQRAGATFNVVPAGERWADGSLRPCLEDWLGAGAVLSHLPGRRSPEADAAVAVFERCRGELSEAIRHCSSGRELEARGQTNDLALASALDASACAPRFEGAAFVGGGS